MNTRYLFLWVLFFSLFSSPLFALSPDKFPNGILSLDRKTGNYRLLWRGVKEDTLLMASFVPANKITPQVVSAISFNAKTNITTYSYELSSAASSEQKLADFYIVPVDKHNLKNPSMPQLWDWSGTNPVDWVAWTQRKGRTQEETNTGLWGIPPGGTEKGFSFESSDLPGVIVAYFKGLAPILSISEEMPEELGRAVDQLSSLKNDSVKKYIIGPGVKISDITSWNTANALLFLERIAKAFLIVDVSGSASLSQFSDKEGLDRISLGIYKAQRALVQNKREEAVKALRELQKELPSYAKKGVDKVYVDALLINLNVLLEKLATIN